MPLDDRGSADSRAAVSDEKKVESPVQSDPQDSEDEHDEEDPAPVDEREGGRESGERSDRQEVEEAAPAPSRASSVFSRTPQSTVPRSRRRGILARFAVIPEVERPYEYKDKTKWAITAVIALAAAAAPVGSGIFYPSLSSMAVDLHTTPTITNLAVALYMLSMSIFPLWWSAFSETFGRRSIYVISFALFVVFSVLSAVSVNISMLIVMRMVGGGASASVQAVGAGTIADIWEPAHRGRAMGIFYLGPLLGPLFAPIIGGALAEGFGWRSTMWFLTIYGALMLLLIIFCLPETKKKPAGAAPPQAPAAPPAPAPAAPAAAAAQQPPRTSEAQPTTPGGGGGSSSSFRPADEPPQAATSNALVRTTTVQSVKQTGRAVKRFLFDPLQVLLYLRFPAVAIAVYSAAVAFGSLFILNISIQSTFSHAPYGFSEIIVGLLYIPLSLGYMVGSTLGGRWIDRIMAREARRAGRYDAGGRLVFLPEDRMRENMWLAASVYPAALIWYGWTAQNGVHWIVPCVANFFFGGGSMLVFGAVTTVLTEFMPQRSSGGVAVNNFVRNIFSCVGGIVAQPLIDAMGNGWLCTMVGLFAWVTGNLAIWALRRWSPKWRVKMDEKLNSVPKA